MRGRPPLVFSEPQMAARRMKMEKGKARVFLMGKGSSPFCLGLRGRGVLMRWEGKMT